MEDLGKVMVVPKGAYNANTTYEILDLVTYNGSSYVALKSTKGNVPTNTAYWQLHGQGYPGSAAGVPAKDTQGMVVAAGSNSTVQALIDAVADKVMTKLFAKANIAQTESTATDKVPSSAYLKSVKDDINSNLGSTNNRVSSLEENFSSGYDGPLAGSTVRTKGTEGWYVELSNNNQWAAMTLNIGESIRYRLQIENTGQLTMYRTTDNWATNQSKVVSEGW
ncbi:hypothetical protein HMPREF9469_01801 [ [[Clostridium] citroniae WAL-17108]|jgi:hypothetical protein|uniref:Uncharacterized protein n=2 Tax=Enterocloster citroniae TaxID=358743 RepID=G5HGN2_9FIRM|nr:hypothetical protein [Enterocloster citroniae]EHE99232.1 hypothetical protein HMPREF9469_01801 [ [[Clostridium] citroniae WAL-17108]DAZ16443.1 MAG TPA: hypothetical protein [Caudoviricetes sp.]